MRIWLFDIDGTLIASGGAGQRAMAQALHCGFGKPADTGPVQFSGRTDRSIAADLFAYHGLNGFDDHWNDFIHHYLQSLPTELGRLSGRIMPGVGELLQLLHNLPRQSIGLLTGNIPLGASTKLRHFQLDTLFRFGFYGDQHLDRDDVAREAQRTLIERFGRPAHELDIWIVGDTPRDIQCGRIIGARTIAVATGCYSVDELAACEPDRVVSDLRYLLDDHRLWNVG
jgi:phosphoglycolate phosphatase-like HAD superfamily hydrolase